VWTCTIITRGRTTSSTHHAAGGAAPQRSAESARAAKNPDFLCCVQQPLMHLFNLRQYQYHHAALDPAAHHHAAMDSDSHSDQYALQQTQLAKQLGVQHLCSHLCSVQHLFGNAYRCESSGQVRLAGFGGPRESLLLLFLLRQGACVRTLLLLPEGACAHLCTPSQPPLTPAAPPQSNRRSTSAMSTVRSASTTTATRRSVASAARCLPTHGSSPRHAGAYLLVGTGCMGPAWVGGGSLHLNLAPPQPPPPPPPPPHPLAPSQEAVLRRGRGSCGGRVPQARPGRGPCKL